MTTMFITERLSSVQSASELQAGLLAALQPGVRLSIDTRDLCNVDLSFPQTIEAARRHAVTVGASIVFLEPASGALAQVLRHAGLRAGFTPADIAFWYHGETPQ